MSLRAAVTTLNLLLDEPVQHSEQRMTEMGGGKSLRKRAIRRKARKSLVYAIPHPMHLHGTTGRPIDLV